MNVFKIMPEFCFHTSGAPEVIWCVCGTLADIKPESMTATIHTTMVFKSIVLTCSQNNTMSDSFNLQIPGPKGTLCVSNEVLLLLFIT